MARPAAGAVRATARPANRLLKTAGKALDGIASAFEGLFGSGSAKATPDKGGKQSKDYAKTPLDAGAVPPKAEQDEAAHREQEQKSARRQKYLRIHAREVPDEKQRDADIQRDPTTGRERTRE